MLGKGEKNEVDMGARALEVGLPGYFRMLILWVRAMRTTTAAKSTTTTFGRFFSSFPASRFCLPEQLFWLLHSFTISLEFCLAQVHLSR